MAARRIMNTYGGIIVNNQEGLGWKGRNMTLGPRVSRDKRKLLPRFGDEVTLLKDWSGTT